MRQEKQGVALLTKNSYLDHAVVLLVGAVHLFHKLVEVFEFLHGRMKNRHFLNYDLG